MHAARNIGGGNLRHEGIVVAHFIGAETVTHVGIYGNTHGPKHCFGQILSGW